MPAVAALGLSANQRACPTALRRDGRRHPEYLSARRQSQDQDAEPKHHHHHPALRQADNCSIKLLSFSPSSLPRPTVLVSPITSLLSVSLDTDRPTDPIKPPILTTHRHHVATSTCTGYADRISGESMHYLSTDSSRRILIAMMNQTS